MTANRTSNTDLYRAVGALEASSQAQIETMRALQTVLSEVRQDVAEIKRASDKRETVWEHVVDQSNWTYKWRGRMAGVAVAFTMMATVAGASSSALWGAVVEAFTP